MELRELLHLQTHIPSAPKVIALLLVELERLLLDLNRVNQLLSSDPKLTLRLLTLANSEAYGSEGEVGSVSQALALLSIKQVTDIVRDEQSHTSVTSVPGMDLQTFWNYSAQVARLCRSMAGLVRLNPQHAYTAGLLHAIGEIGLQVHCREQCEQMDGVMPALDVRRALYERQQIGYSYANVSSGYARQAKLPAAIVNALGYQHVPFERDVIEPLAGIVHLAVWRARVELAQYSQKAIVVSFPDSVGVALGLDFDTVMRQDPFDWVAYIA